jgi:hypothetical protein
MKSLIAAAVIFCLAAGSATAQVRDNRTRRQLRRRQALRPLAEPLSPLTTTAVALANVVAIGALTGTLKLTTTEIATGSFHLRNSRPTATLSRRAKPSYIGAVAGARRAARPGTPVVVASDQKISGVKVALPRGAVIAGTILG